jgi:hypothetical protein
LLENDLKEMEGKEKKKPELIRFIRFCYKKLLFDRKIGVLFYFYFSSSSSSSETKNCTYLCTTPGGGVVIIMDLSNSGEGSVPPNDWDINLYLFLPLLDVVDVVNTMLLLVVLVLPVVVVVVVGPLIVDVRISSPVQFILCIIGRCGIKSERYVVVGVVVVVQFGDD